MIDNLTIYSQQTKKTKIAILQLIPEGEQLTFLHSLFSEELLPEQYSDTEKWTKLSFFETLCHLYSIEKPQHLPKIVTYAYGCFLKILAQSRGYSIQKT